MLPIRQRKCTLCGGTGFEIAGAAWVPTAWLCAQLSHLGWGAFGMLVTSLAADPAWGWGVLAVWVVLKDLVFDVLVESSPLADEAVDGIFYVLGGFIGLVAWCLLRTA